MFDLQSLAKLNPDDIILLNELLPMAREAKRIEELIKSTYLFHVGEERIQVDTNDDCHCEFLTHDGKWLCSWTRSEYEVLCNAPEIFELMKAKYMLDNNYFEDTEAKKTAEKKAQTWRHFKSFVVVTEELAEEKAKKD